MIYIHNILGTLLVIHQVKPMIIVEHNRNHIINLLLIKNVNTIVMTEQHEILLPEMCMIDKEWTIRVSLIVVYKTPT